MRKRIILWLFAIFLFFGVALSGYTQKTDDIFIYIIPQAANPLHTDFFGENFSREAIAAGYIVTDNVEISDFILILTVMPNLIFFDDGTEAPAPPDEEQYRLRLALLRSSDNAEVMAFSFLFNELQEIDSPRLLQDIMINAPIFWPEQEAPVMEIVREVFLEVVREIEVIREIEIEVIREVRAER